MRVCRALIVVVASALVTLACGGGGVAPVVERGTVGAGGGRSAGSSRATVATAGSEAVDTDWTATVRPLGDSGISASRALASEETAPAASAGTTNPASLPASTQGSAAGAPGAGGAASLQSSAAAPGAALPPASLQSSAAAPGAALPPASLQSSATVNPAVVSLLNTASAQSRAGDHVRAADTLERAIAIQPDNAWLWYRLADTRLKEGRLEQAAALAAKSNSLATADRSLQADTWKLIAEIRRRQGDGDAAASAESQAAELLNL